MRINKRVETIKQQAGDSSLPDTPRQRYDEARHIACQQVGVNYGGLIVPGTEGNYYPTRTYAVVDKQSPVLDPTARKSDCFAPVVVCKPSVPTPVQTSGFREENAMDCHHRLPKFVK